MEYLRATDSGRALASSPAVTPTMVKAKVALDTEGYAVLFVRAVDKSIGIYWWLALDLSHSGVIASAAGKTDAEAWRRLTQDLRARRWSFNSVAVSAA